MSATPTAVPACPMQCISLVLLYSSNSPRQPARQIDWQTVTQTKILRMEGCTTRFVTYGCESAQQLSVTVCLHKADIE